MIVSERGLIPSFLSPKRWSEPRIIIVFASLGLFQTLQVTLGGGDNFEVINFRLAVLALTLYTAAFVCEALRSGINTVPAGQAEAARALGLSFTQVLRVVILPQAFRAVVNPLANVLIALTKNTTVAATIGVAEAALLMKEMIENEAQTLLIGAVFASSSGWEGESAEKARDGLLTVVKWAENTSDHATNVAEDVIFMVSARDVRHHAAEAAEPRQG